MKKQFAAKHTQSLSRVELQEVLAVARGEHEADLLITNCKLLDLVCGELNETVLAMKGKTIAGVGMEYKDTPAKEVWDAQ